MSFPYPYIDHYSPSPVTSNTSPAGAFAQWDITQETGPTNATQQQVMQQQLQQQAQQQQQQAQQQQGQQQQDFDRNTPTSTASTPAGYEPPQVIQLTERVPRRRVRIQNPEVSTSATATTATSATNAGGNNSKSQSPSTPLRNLHQLQQPTPQSAQQHHGKHQQHQESETSGGGGGGAVRQMNTSRAQARLSSHPYQHHQHRRSVSGSGESKSKRDAAEYQQATSPTTGLMGAAQIVMACGGAKGRGRSPSQASAGSPTTSPTQSLHPLSDAAPPAPVRRMLIRTDVHQSSETHMLTAMLELPGVNKADVRVALSVDPFSGVHQLTVTGRSVLRFPSEGEGWYLVRERKYGEFRRVLVVPPDTKTENIEASLEDGILYLRYPGAAPPTPQDDRASSPTDEPTIINVA